MKKTLILSTLLTSICLFSCNNEEVKYIPTNYEIITVQPFYTSLLERCKDDTKIPFPDGVETESDILIQGASNLANSLDNVSYKSENKLIDEVIDKTTFEKFGPNQIILIQSHGEYIDPFLHETILTGTDFDASKVSEEDEERIVESFMWNDQTYNMYEAITFKYVEAYCPDISGSIVYLGQCFGGYDWALATSFLDKGAIAVYGASYSIQMHYGDMMQYRITSLLGEINQKTNNYYTTGEALSKAQEEYGINDSVLYEGSGLEARILLYGDPNFRLNEK